MMRPRQCSLICGRVLYFILALVLVSGSAFAAPEILLYGFQGTGDGTSPYAGLVADAAGNLYGTTFSGGGNPACNCGTVFELSPPATAGDAWTESIIHIFQGGINDGAGPKGTLTIDQHGNLYGTTTAGGAGGGGTVFELSPPATLGGAWTGTVLFAFLGPDDFRGSNPQGKVVFDAAGNLYGSTQNGGSKWCNCGTVFELKAPAPSGGAWTHLVLYNFGPRETLNGYSPGSDIIYRNGVIYGVTTAVDTRQHGTVFQLVRKPGTWAENVIYQFTDSEGTSPVGGLVIDAAGNLYGTTANGGNANCPAGCGTIFELSPPAVTGGAWQRAILYNFLSQGDGAYPVATLWRDSLGNLYGTAYNGGTKNKFNQREGGGTVFKLKAPAVAGDAWTLAVLHDFNYPTTADGSFPHGALTMFNGVFYGTTLNGGDTTLNNYGTVFSVVP